MPDSFRPTAEQEVAEIVAWAAAEEVPLSVLGSGSKQGFGRPVQAERDLALSGLSGITLYEPEELVLTARAGTPLAEVLAAVETKNQMLAFEPPDLAPLYGGAAGAGTLGGLLAANLAGSRRPKVGAARDHLLGFRAVSGRGEVFKAGGRVVKNVTGYDLAKLMAGSFGTLAVLTEVTVKVMPRAEKTRSLLVFGLDPEEAVAAMTAALNSPHEVSGAAWLPDWLAAESRVSYLAEAGTSVTALRLEGPLPSVTFRCQALRQNLGRFGPAEELHGANSALLWREVSDGGPFARRPELAVWRLSLPPARGGRAAARLLRLPGALGYLDWGGGLLWLALPPGESAEEKAVRSAAAEAGGHGTLLRAPYELRAALPVFQPQAEPLAALTRRVKESFDPRRVLNPGRMYAEV